MWNLNVHDIEGKYIHNWRWNHKKNSIRSHVLSNAKSEFKSLSLIKWLKVFVYPSAESQDVLSEFIDVFSAMLLISDSDRAMKVQTELYRNTGIRKNPFLIMPLNI